VDVSGYRHSDQITIARPPEAVYAIVSDVSRVGELSPVCQSASWDDPDAAGREGAWFTGHNVIGDVSWDTHCKVVAADPGREFAFVNHGPNGDVELVRWGYVFAPDGDGTRVTEAWELLPAYPGFVSGGDPNLDVSARLDGMAQLARDGIQETLGNLKRIAES
jgi:carbon monoxide dehydrogenase subunit G